MHEKGTTMPRALMILGVVLLLGACQTTPQVAELESEKTALQAKLAEAEQRIGVLEREEARLRQHTTELERVAGVLATEKSSRVEESAQLRQQVRKFIQQQIDELRAFLVKGELLDYVGSELVERSHIEPKALTLVDLAHPMPRQGTLTGVTGYFSAPTQLQLKVLRPVEDEYVVIWESELLSVPGAGEQTVQLPVSVGVESGDVVAYAFPEAARVSFDKGTGDTRYTGKDLALGDTISASSLSGKKENRAYSLGVYAILD
jgi:hypothetical protein